MGTIQTEIRKHLRKVADITENAFREGFYLGLSCNDRAAKAEDFIEKSTAHAQAEIMRRDT